MKNYGLLHFPPTGPYIRPIYPVFVTIRFHLADEWKRVVAHISDVNHEMEGRNAWLGVSHPAVHQGTLFTRGLLYFKVKFFWGFDNPRSVSALRPRGVWHYQLQFFFVRW